MDKLDGIEKRKVMEMMKTNQTGAITLDWMYREDKPEGEDYLLGKEVDKHIEGEPVASMEDEFDAKFGERIKANIALDMATKMREDPLFIIKQKEIEARKKIVENPIKMKQLQAMIEKQKKKQEKKKKKKKHKKKDSDSEDDLVAQYLSILNKKKQQNNQEDKPRVRRPPVQHSASEDSDTEQIRERSHRKRHHERGNERSDRHHERGNEHSDRHHERGNERSDRHWKRGNDRHHERVNNRHNDRLNDRHHEKVNDRHHERGSDRGSHNKRNFDHKIDDRERRDRDRQYQGRDRSGYSKSQRDVRDGESRSTRNDGREEKSGEWGRDGRGDRNSNRHAENDRNNERNRHRNVVGRDRSFSSGSNTKSPQKYKKDGRRQRSESDQTDGRKTRNDHPRSKRHTESNSADHKTDLSSDSDSEPKKDSNSKRTKKEVKNESSSSESSSEEEMPLKKKSRHASEEQEEISQHHGKNSYRDDEIQPKQYGLILSSNHQPSHHRSKSPTKYKATISSEPKKQRSRSPRRKSPKRPLSEKEREKKLAEMMENAKWRNEQRKKNVTRYKEEEDKEQDEIINDHKSSFVNDMMSEHASQSSLEDRLNRNKHHIQRTQNALNKNFLRK